MSDKDDILNQAVPMQKTQALQRRELLEYISKYHVEFLKLSPDERARLKLGEWQPPAQPAPDAPGEGQSDK